MTNTVKPYKLTKRASVALEKSILHWKEHLATETPAGLKLGGNDCALCAAFMTAPAPCVHCPVAIRVGDVSCWKTPYFDVLREYKAWVGGAGPVSTREACRAEIAFLESLREEPK